MLVEASSPARDGIGVAAQFGGDLLIGRPVRVGAAEDESCAGGASLRRGAGVDQLLEEFAFAEVQSEDDRFASHESSPQKRGQARSGGKIIAVDEKRPSEEMYTSVQVMPPKLRNPRLGSI
jgi:hypothetical protein